MIETRPAPFKSKFRGDAGEYVVRYMKENNLKNAWVTSSQIVRYHALPLSAATVMTHILLGKKVHRPGYRVLGFEHRTGKLYRFHLELLEQADCENGQ
jgi:hypothetical protein